MTPEVAQQTARRLDPTTWEDVDRVRRVGEHAWTVSRAVDGSSRATSARPPDAEGG